MTTINHLQSSLGLAIEANLDRAGSLLQLAKDQMPAEDVSDLIKKIDDCVSDMIGHSEVDTAPVLQLLTDTHKSVFLLYQLASDGEVTAVSQLEAYNCYLSLEALIVMIKDIDSNSPTTKLPHHFHSTLNVLGEIVGLNEIERRAKSIIDDDAQSDGCRHCVTGAHFIVGLVEHIRKLEQDLASRLK